MEKDMEKAPDKTPWLNELKDNVAAVYMPGMDPHWMMFVTEDELLNWGHWLLSRKILGDPTSCPDQIQKELASMRALLADENVEAFERMSKLLDWIDKAEVLPYWEGDKLFDYHSLLEDAEWQRRFNEFLDEQGMSASPMSENLELLEQMLFSSGVDYWQMHEIEE